MTLRNQGAIGCVHDIDSQMRNRHALPCVSAHEACSRTVFLIETVRKRIGHAAL